MKAGFEPAPLRTRALIWRLRPLGHPILSAVLHADRPQKTINIQEARLVTFNSFLHLRSRSAQVPRQSCGLLLRDLGFCESSLSLRIKPTTQSPFFSRASRLMPLAAYSPPWEALLARSAHGTCLFRFRCELIVCLSRLHIRSINTSNLMVQSSKELLLSYCRK